MTVVVATADFELYHGVVNELRDRDAKFTTIEPGDPLPAGATVLITGAPDEIDPDDAEIDRVVGDPNKPRETVDAALSVSRDGRRIVGVDPGDHPGIAVLSGDEVIAAFQVPLSEAVGAIRAEVAEAVDPIVRIGDGARLQGARIVDDLQDVRVELVDETGTTPHLGTGARGMGDVLAAANIARRKGEPVTSLDVEPTQGEIRTIQSASRDRSVDNRAIPGDLARRVANGELSIDDALAEHRD